MKEMTFDGEAGVFLTAEEHASLRKNTPIQRGQVWRRKMLPGNDPHYIYLLAVDDAAQVVVDQIIKSPNDPAPKYEGSGGGVGYARTFRDVRLKYEFVGAAP
ncbi:hypothetical protein ACIP79_00730 [Streptomyces sp. NPDC088747]|uniref:hypothetical protein n=1 Tax=Streptomyces sp. NPDC088747 TaxID=3365886 RepID=UPI00381D60C2